MNFSISGTSRDPEKRKCYQEIGYKIVDFSSADIDKVLKQSTHLLMSIPPVAGIGDPMLANFSLLEKYHQQLEWVGYISSTAVYGNHYGAWVDETKPPANLGARAILRLEAEIAWLDIAKKLELPLHIFRLAGIYGSNRNVLRDIFNGKTESIYKEGNFFSRIHVEDISKVIQASIQEPNPHSIYNVADDLPAPSHEVDAYACFLLNKQPLPLIPFEQAVLSDMGKEFYSNNRRVSNAKIKKEFKLQLNYPSYKEGLMQLYQKGYY